MTSENILESNKVIAEFMGFTIEPNIGYYDNEMLLPQHVYDVQNGNCFDELLFDKSWDWLMPVVEKISKLPYIDLFSIVTNCGSDIYFKNPEFIRSTSFLSISTDEIPLIDAVYSTTVEFIKYYYAYLENPPTKL